MKILVLGSNGQLGSCLRDQLDSSNNEIIFYTKNDIDLCDPNCINEKILLIKPEIIINAAAYTMVDEAEDNADTAYSINHIAVKYLANIANQLDCWLFHISTDYVFDGLGNKPYVEKDITNPLNVYGRSKLLGENEIQSSKCKYIIIRTSWVFSEYGKNFLKTMVSLCGKKTKVNIVSDQMGCPTYAQDIGKIINQMVLKINSNSLDSNIFHYCGDKICSWYEFAKFIFNEAKKCGYSVPSAIYSVPTDLHDYKANRPLYSVLDCSKINNIYSIKKSNWKIGVTKSIKALNRNND